MLVVEVDLWAVPSDVDVEDIQELQSRGPQQIPLVLKPSHSALQKVLSNARKFGYIQSIDQRRILALLSMGSHRYPLCPFLHLSLGLVWRIIDFAIQARVSYHDCVDARGNGSVSATESQGGAESGASIPLGIEVP